MEEVIFARLKGLKFTASSQSAIRLMDEEIVSAEVETVTFLRGHTVATQVVCDN